MSVLFVALAIVLGAIPFGVLVAKRRGIDLRERGSGNIGATNVWRVHGRRLGLPAVFLDTTRILEQDAAISLPYMLRRYRSADIDPLREAILTYPVLHYQNGGLVIDDQGETTLEGVYACGEIAGGTHGRNRMMGNSLLECTVFGRRSGAAAAEKVRG